MLDRSTEIVIATGNEGKALEIARALCALPLKLRTLKDFHFVCPLEEVGGSYQENASAKALSYAAQTGRYALADDSGLEVKSLGGRPGVHSERFGGSDISDADRNQLLLRFVGHGARHARFVCVCVLAEPSRGGVNPAHLLHTTIGVCEGQIAYATRGVNGFGYDSIFIPNGHKETFAELPNVIKDRISHRAKALSQMWNFLKDQIGELDRSSTHS